MHSCQLSLISWAYKFDNLPNWGNFSSNMYVILQVCLIGEENLPDFLWFQDAKYWQLWASPGTRKRTKAEQNTQILLILIKTGSSVGHNL